MLQENNVKDDGPQLPEGMYWDINSWSDNESGLTDVHIVKKLNIFERRLGLKPPYRNVAATGFEFELDPFDGKRHAELVRESKEYLYNLFFNSEGNLIE